MRRTFHPSASPIALAIACLLLHGVTSPEAHAQVPTQADVSLPGITVTAPKARESRTSIGGFENTPAWQQPMQAERFSDQALKTAQVQRLADVTKLDASISDFYNAGGYWDFLTVRGYVLDVTHNYRREGLPINAETSIALDNKAAVEVLKGTSGMQAGTSSPGGLVNYVVKRPDGRTRTAELAFTGHRSVLTAVDLGDRFGQTEQFGLRVNAAHEHLNTAIRNTRGQRDLLALAGDWRVAPGTLLEAEIEYSKRSQPSVPGFSLLGSTLPSASSINPNINLNNQAWTQPLVMQGTTGTLRATHELNASWKLVGTYGEQSLRSDDRAAFPFGTELCYNTGLECDRYAANGSFYLYDYRSPGEVRVTRALDVHTAGQITLGSTTHDITAGAMRSLTRIDVPTAAYNGAGVGDITGNVSVPASPLPTLNAQNDRQERSNEFYLRDSIKLSDAWRAWAGLRHTQLTRAQTLSDLSQPTSRVVQDLTTPWLALGYEWAPKRQAYASWGEGVEVLPAKFTSPLVTYANSGQVLPAAKSRQWELGFKGSEAQLDWAVNYFYVVRPEVASVADQSFVLTYQRDGDARHQGLEGQVSARIQAYALTASAMVLDAERRHSVKDGVNGKAPSNVPDYAIKLGNSYRVAAVPGLSLQGDIVHEGPRTADVVNDVRLPAWTRIDVGASLVQRLGDKAVTWRLGVTNLLDTRAWRESPNQFDHIYLIPLAERTFTASAQISF